MSGPAPKPPGQRRRRNAPARGDWIVLPETDSARPVPSLVRLAPEVSWTGATKRWWKAIWRTPMSTQWGDGDYPVLVELAYLRQLFMPSVMTDESGGKVFVQGDARLAPEVRHRSDAFGLTPKGRQERRWLLPGHGDGRPEDEAQPDELEARRARRERLDGIE
jgi:hypothetical protein